MDNIYLEIMKMFPKLNTYIMAGWLVLARLLGFFRYAPIFSRKEIPTLVKIPMAIIIAGFMVPMLSPEKVMAECDSFALSLVLNIVVGAIIGYMARLVLIAIDSGAEMMNMQMGLSAATTFDPSTSAQVSLMTKIISIMALLIFIQVGGA